MSEAVAPQIPIDQAHTDELDQAHLRLIEIGGNQVGGQIEVPLSDIEPITSKLVVNGTNASVLAVMYAGHHKLGLVDARPDEPRLEMPFQDDRLLLVDLAGDPEGDPDNLTITTSQDGRLRAMVLREPDTMARIGSDDAFSSVHFNEVLGLAGDEALSPKHLRFRVTENGELGVYDSASSTGTGLLLRQKNTEELIQDTHSNDAMQEVENNDTLLAKEEELGEAAVKEVVEEPQLDTSYDNMPRRSQAMKELQDHWGLPEEVQVDAAVRKLETTLTQVDNMLSATIVFDEMYPVLRRAITDSVNANANQIKSQLIDDFEMRVLQAPGFQAAKGLNRENAIFLPKSLERTLRQISGDFYSFETIYRDMLKGYGGSLVLDDAPGVLSFMDRIPHESRVLLSIRAQVDDMRQRLSGYHDDSAERVEGTVNYRNEQVEQWAERLKRKDITEDELEEIRQEMEQAVRQEAQVVDDPNSPSRFFGYAVRMNMGKSRHGAYASGREGGNTRSQKYVSEVMLDMLRGKFDVAGADTILLNPKLDSGVEAGLHRSAALAMIYGAKDWVQVAKRLGYKIDSK
jgi:hypothetical protein